MEHLPEGVRAAVAASMINDLEVLGQLADNVYNVVSGARVAAIGVPTTSQEPVSSQQITELIGQVAALTTMLVEDRNSRRRTTERDPSKPKSGYRPRSRSRTSDHGDDSSVCWYHRKFGQNAQKCTKPCSFVGNNQQSR